MLNGIAATHATVCRQSPQNWGKTAKAAFPLILDKFRARAGPETDQSNARRRPSGLQDSATRRPEETVGRDCDLEGTGLAERSEAQKKARPIGKHSSLGEILIMPTPSPAAVAAT